MTTTLQTSGEAIEAAQVVVDRVALLVAENERLKANDARYRWLRSPEADGRLVDDDKKRNQVYAVWDLLSADECDPNELDAYASGEHTLKDC